MSSPLPPIVFFDLETGGLDWTRHPIIQLAAVATDGAGAIHREFEAKLAFDEAAADPQALAMNHYTPEAWAQAEPEDVVLRRFADWLAPFVSVPKTSAKGRPYRVARLGGHNAAAFDGPFLQAAFRHHGIFLPADYHIFDTMSVALVVHLTTGRQYPSLKLVDLCAVYGIPLAEAHDALADVKATAQLAQVLLSELQDRRSGAST